ncbi:MULTISPECIES: universal stress protein [Microvirgula]|uniref:Universal stress protein n=1 Tax=Microvirgula aerodenitrificans TaxID=57480 RepID=A0A2S0PDW6_9NEIS|nr:MULTISPECIES: universal stress protein [Microvirgula]AVY95578.1 universal stress protein [Microvirgula aerodenitrificans]RAS13756.1 nucleotide-binding universal stress UspA family protein [Microvirgula sp. AG722]
MYQHILVPVDGSPEASHGLREAINLAQSLNATLKLVHIIDPMVAYIAMNDLGGGNAASHTAALREAGKTILEQALALATAAGIKVETELFECTAPTVADLIVEQARRWPADMIVMGTHGRRGLTRLLMGSDAEMVLRNSPVPVLMVRSA